jgi:4-amino-4-deoxy-L-arabinose transferase-like glycosyltransferase
MGIKIKAVLFLFLALYLAYHLFTLPLNPLPWFDETFFASISKSYAETGRLIPQIAQEMWQGQEIFIYGPVFFFLESISIHLFGFGIFQYRIVPFLFGILTIIAIFSLLKEYCHTKKWPFLAVVAFSLDPFLNLSMHEGRMDLVAAFFMVMSVLCMAKSGRQHTHLYYFVSGLFAVLSLLTTPRSGIIFISIFLLIIQTTVRQPPRLTFHVLLWWLFPVISLYALWTYYAFGGLQELISYYQHLRETNAEYIGGRGYIPKHEMVLIPLTLVSVGLAIVIQGIQFFHTVVMISLLSILLFYLFVLDWGPYSALILPFYYFLLFYSLDTLYDQGKKLPLYLGSFATAFQCFLFYIKSCTYYF